MESPKKQVEYDEAPSPGVDTSRVREVAQNVLSEVANVIVGKGDHLQFIFIALLTNGHCLLEGVPGLAKTVMAKTFAEALGIKFKRVQFTPDLLPSDITGSMVFDQSTGEFVLRRGPVFANFVLADEINRAAPKTQSALLEAMGEKQVTIEGQTMELESPFIVLATQNPIEQEGTYPLPEAQLDRFLFKLWLDYPTKEEEVKILSRQETGQVYKVRPVTTSQEILEIQDLVKQVYIDTTVLNYIRDLIYKTREDPQILLGAGPRASLVLMKCAKARAAILGRNFVTPDDVKELCFATLNHRLMLKPETELEGITVQQVINRIIDEVQVPI
jgi:MoxR-like ATPase